MKELHIFHGDNLTTVKFSNYSEYNNTLFVYQMKHGKNTLIAVFTNYDWYDVV